ncbi:MAG: hypothetical protein J6W29_00420, partial [Neisseriaceae bacterium]|nr:hypothetical protein [Neisseriaceae bacterium]
MAISELIARAINSGSLSIITTMQKVFQAAYKNRSALPLYLISHPKCYAFRRLPRRAVVRLAMR